MSEIELRRLEGAADAANHLLNLVHNTQTTDSQDGTVKTTNSTDQKGCIFRVPTAMRRVDEQAFDPLVVSIGPYCHDKAAELEIKKDHKLRVVDYLLGNQTRGMTEMAIDGLEEDMKHLENWTRECYVETFDDISSDDFVSMMVLDGCFILGLLLACHPESKDFPSIPIISTRWMLPSIKLDLIKLENQIPFFLLRSLLESLERMKLADFKLSLEELAFGFFAPLLPGAEKIPWYNPDGNFEHLLALFHSILKPECYESAVDKYKRSPNPDPCEHSLVGARKLFSRGIFLTEGKSSRLFKISFENGAWKIPRLTIDQGITAQVLRNLVVYEQGNRHVEARVTSYVQFMDGIVDAPEDVAYLRDKGIVHAFGSDEEINAFINSLTKGIPHYKDECFLCKLDNSVNPIAFKLIQAVQLFFRFLHFLNSMVLAVIALFLSIKRQH